MIKWVEISTKCETERFQLLAEALSIAGTHNEVSFLEIGGEVFPETIDRAKKDFDQIRVGGGLCELLPKLADRMPSTLLTLRAADAIVQGQGQWWPRNFTVLGVISALTQDLGQLDLSGGAFIVGANADTRSVVAALVRIGFVRLSLSGPDEVRTQVLVEEFKRIYFGVQFQFIPRRMITQLPGVHSVAVNTVRVGEDDGILTDLLYFNFLKPKGIWLDLPLVSPNPSLGEEALSVGARVESGVSVNLRIDHAWAKSCLGTNIDLKSHRDRLAQAFERKSDV